MPAVEAVGGAVLRDRGDAGHRVVEPLEIALAAGDRVRAQRGEADVERREDVSVAL